MCFSQIGGNVDYFRCPIKCQCLSHGSMKFWKTKKTILNIPCGSNMSCCASYSGLLTEPNAVVLRLIIFYKFYIGSDIARNNTTEIKLKNTTTVLSIGIKVFLTRKICLREQQTSLKLEDSRHGMCRQIDIFFLFGDSWTSASGELTKWIQKKKLILHYQSWKSIKLEAFLVLLCCQWRNTLFKVHVGVDWRRRTAGSAWHEILWLSNMQNYDKVE